MHECTYRDTFELLLVLEYDEAATLPDGAVLAPELVSDLERTIARRIGRLLPDTPMYVMLSSIATVQQQLHLRGVVLTNLLEGFRWAGQLTPELRTYKDPLLAGVHNDMLVLSRRPDRDAPALCRLLRQYDQLHADVRQQLHRQFADDGRRAQRLGLQYYGLDASTTQQAVREMIDNAHYHKRYLVTTAAEPWLAQYADLLDTFAQRNARERSHGFSPAAVGMRTVMGRVAAALLAGVQRILQRQPPSYPSLDLDDWDAGTPTPPDDGSPYAEAREAWWNRMT